VIYNLFAHVYISFALAALNVSDELIDGQGNEDSKNLYCIGYMRVLELMKEEKMNLLPILQFHRNSAIQRSYSSGHK